MPNYTLTFSPPAEGWPSFYSYYPDWIQGMNQHLYTFSGGNLFQHNTNETRNNFYGEQYNSTLQSVFNDEPIVNKIFKTLQLEGDHPWAATLTSDQQDTGFIESAFFEKKEGDWFSFVRNAGATPADPDEYALRSLNGIGLSSSVVSGVGGAVINFPLTTSIGSILSVGDNFYFSEDPYTVIQWAGEVTTIDVNLPAGVNRVVIDTSGAGTVPIVGQTPLWLGIKNQIAESNGILGHYGVFTLTNEDTEAVELFVVRSEVMKSFP